MIKRNSKLFSPYAIGTISFKNRILFPSMCANYCDGEGNFTTRYIAFIMARIESGIAGIIIPGTAYGVHGHMRPSLSEDRFIPGWSKLADEIHSRDAKLICQLHPASFNPPRVKNPNNPSEFSQELIDELVESFAHAAYRCLQAGIDGVEIHGAHAHEIAAFSSPYYNKRTDEYGGDYVGRSKLGVDIIRRIKKMCGSDYPLIFRMNGEDKLEGGRAIDEGAKVARLFESAGADAVHISAGLGPSAQYTEGTMDLDECLLVDDAAYVKANVGIPVIAVNRIMDLEQASVIIDEDKADMVAMGRAFLVDPLLIKKALGEIEAPNVRCLGCKDHCGTRKGGALSCVLNPIIGHEFESVS